jgi:endonuclease/exonuclease/phosphatase (EEP) superfamily protein YafD
MRLRRTLAAGSTVVVVALGGIAAARTARIDERVSTLIALETLTPWVFLPAWGALAVGIAQRRRGLTAAAAVLALCHAAWIWGDLPLWRARQPDATGSAITLVTANVYKYNGQAPAFGRAVSELRPDVLALQELTPHVHRGLVESRLLDGFPYRWENVEEGSFGSGIYSRLPICGRNFVTTGGARMVRATLDAGGTPVDVVSVHTVQPMAVPSILRRQLSDLAGVAERAERPLILAGDFNATRQYRPFRRLLAGPLRDAHLELGRGFSATWPANADVPPFSLIDHVLVSAGIAVDGVSEHTLPGSDHRTVVARLRLPAPGQVQATERTRDPLGCRADVKEGASPSGSTLAVRG